MKLSHLSFLICLLARVQSPSAADFDSDKFRNWHQWRGPEASGVSRDANPPVTWGPNSNIRWKTAIDGRGSSTPIIWGHRIFLLTSAVNTGKVDPTRRSRSRPVSMTVWNQVSNTEYEFIVVCLDRRTGRELWKRTAARRTHEGHHGDNNFASASPVTDGQRLYAWFGMAGIFCYDFKGELLWKRSRTGQRPGRSFAEASSPVVHDGRVIINRDHEGQSYIAVLDAETGKDVWRAERDEPSTWMTPLVVEHNGTTQVVTSASNRVRSYDPETGKVIWGMRRAGFQRDAIAGDRWFARFLHEWLPGQLRHGDFAGLPRRRD